MRIPEKALLIGSLSVALAAAAFADETVVVDFTKPEGPIKPLNGICNVRSPIVPGAAGDVADLVEIAELAPAYARVSLRTTRRGGRTASSMR